MPKSYLPLCQKGFEGEVLAHHLPIIGRNSSNRASTFPFLNTLFRHFIDTHPSIHANGDWPNLVDLLVRGLHVKPNTQ